MQEDAEGRAAERAAMVAEQIAARGISDPALLAAMEKVPRHRFVPADLQSSAYDDSALPIGGGQTISQPYIVAAMMAAAGVRAGQRLLDVGTGCGYAAAVAAELGAEVWSVERRDDLAYQARARLMRTGYGRVRVRTGDGRQGWAEGAPFDAILVAAATAEVPPALIAQLAPQGRIVIPLGGPFGQQLCRVTREGPALKVEELEPVRFVPLVAD